MDAPRHDPRELAARIERAQAVQAAATPARAGALPDVLEIAGGLAVSYGPRSPYSAALGIGLGVATAPADVDAVERHLGAGGGAVRIEVTPFTDPTLAAALARRRYRAAQQDLVWWRPVGGAAPPPVTGVEVRPLRPGEEEAWARVFVHGCVGRPAPAGTRPDGALALTRAATNTCFLALVDATPVGVAIASETDGVALLSGAAVAPPYRGRGVQRALIAARLAWAGSRGCDLAAAATAPSTASQRSCERSGFRCAYPKLVLVRDPT